MFHLLLNFLFPPRCPFCGQLETGICPSCSAKIKFIENHSFYRTDYCDYYSAPYYYCSIIREAILHFKYQKYGIDQELFIEKMKNQLSKLNIDGIISVPRYRWQKYDQYDTSKILAVKISKAMALPYIKNAVIKNRKTKIQHHLLHSERLINLENCFTASHRKLAGKSILICDDVITTGATINEMAKACKSAGAKNVYASALAITKRPIV